MELCAGRHKTPALDGAIFENEISDPTNLTYMRDVANEKLYDCEELDLYVTGLTVALIEVINACLDYRIPLTLWHYDKNTDGYYKQELY